MLCGVKKQQVGDFARADLMCSDVYNTEHVRLGNSCVPDVVTWTQHLFMEIYSISVFSRSVNRTSAEITLGDCDNNAPT